MIAPSESRPPRADAKERGPRVRVQAARADGPGVASDKPRGTRSDALRAISQSATLALPTAAASRAASRRRPGREPPAAPRSAPGRPVRGRPGRDRRRGRAAARAARRESRERCGSSAAVSRAACFSAPSSRAIRPTSERLRESIFDILEHRFPAISRARGWSTSSPDRGRWRSRRCRAAPASRSSSTTAPRRARFFAPMSRRSRSAG